jgi:Spx/MgsR family transcriptional regulator
MTLYGIVNCDTVRRARGWLDGRGLGYAFVDLKKAPPPAAELARWCAELGWQAVLNRRGTTWRALGPTGQAEVTGIATAVELMRAQPTAIRRPVVVRGELLLVGFDEADWARRLA